MDRQCFQLAGIKLIIKERQMLYRKGMTSKGFTLVEVIVVAVIVAVLAAVAIPLYLNYITTSRTNSAANSTASIASFCGACVNVNGVPTKAGSVITCVGGTPVTTIEIPPKITILLDAAAKTVTGSHTDGGVASVYNY
jgi:prepilin-type N-terminal cleavage/methylation domain-containing protein